MLGQGLRISFTGRKMVEVVLQASVGSAPNGCSPTASLQAQHIMSHPCACRTYAVNDLFGIEFAGEEYRSLEEVTYVRTIVAAWKNSLNACTDNHNEQHLASCSRTTSRTCTEAGQEHRRAGHCRAGRWTFRCYKWGISTLSVDVCAFPYAGVKQAIVGCSGGTESHSHWLME